jgi:protein involved in temperature-dependent protein secretion
MTKQWAKLGWSLPNGVLAGTMLAINNEYINKRLTTSKDISIKQAEMEQLGLFKSLELGVSFENILITSMTDFAKRRLEAAKINGDILIAVFKERVNLYNTELEKFKADAEVFKTKIQAEMSRVEVYKSKIAAQQLITQVDEAQVKIYTAKIAANEQLVNIYNSKVQAFVALLGAEKNKIDNYKAQIDAYGAKLDAQTKKYLGDVQVFAAKVQATGSHNAVLIANMDATAKTSVAFYEASVKAAEANARIAETQAQVRMAGLQTAAQAASNLAAGALSAIHASVSDSYNNSYQEYKDLTPNS